MNSIVIFFFAISVTCYGIGWSLMSMGYVGEQSMYGCFNFMNHSLYSWCVFIGLFTLALLPDYIYAA